MEKKRCHCNGSRGTDCDWCQGSGWVTESIRLNGLPANAKQFENESKPIIKKVFIVVNNVVKEQTKKATNFVKPKKTFDQRLSDLKKEINHTEVGILDESIAYLRKKIFMLREDLNKIQPKVTKKQSRHYNKLKSETDDIIKKFEEKFSGNKLDTNETKQVQRHVKINTHKRHADKSNLPTLSYKFKELFESIKEKIRKND